MRRKWLLISMFVLVFLWPLTALYSQAPKLPRTLTLVYSNNINGEIDPCPT